jgi:hypothetical protein
MKGCFFPPTTRDGWTDGWMDRCNEKIYEKNPLKETQILQDIIITL